MLWLNLSCSYPICTVLLVRLLVLSGRKSSACCLFRQISDISVLSDALSCLVGNGRRQKSYLKQCVKISLQIARPAEVQRGGKVPGQEPAPGQGAAGPGLDTEALPHREAGADTAAVTAGTKAASPATRGARIGEVAEVAGCQSSRGATGHPGRQGAELPAQQMAEADPLS